MSDINTRATVTLTVNGKQAQEMLEGLKKKSQDLEKAIENAAKSGNKSSLTKLQKELKQVNRQINQIESATAGVEKVLKNLDKATPNELKKTLNQLNKELKNIERGSEAWNVQCEKIKRVKAELKRVNDDLTEAEGKWSRFNRIINDWQTTIMGGAAAVTGLVMAGRSAVKAYAGMEAEMANVRKYTGMSAEEVVELNDELKKIDTRTSREDLNKLAQEAGRLGKSSKEDVLGFVKAADQINVALDDLGEGATLTLSKLTNIFGDEERLGTEKALLAVGSVINELSQNCTASAPYLAQFAQRLAGVGAQAKMTIPEIMGFGAVLDSQGQAVEMSATALSVLITDLFKKQDQIIKATGMNAEKFKETLKRSTNEGLLMLIERLHELGNIDVLAPVFKEMGENGSRAAGVLAALAGNIETIRWEQEEANKAFNEATSVTEEFNVQNNTVQAGLDKASKAIKEVAVDLGQKLMPVMSHIISGTSLLLKAMNTIVTFLIRFRAEIAAAVITLTAFYVAANLAAIRIKIAAAAQAAWNAVVKVGNVLLPIARVMISGLRVAYERVVWQTRGATASQQAYNKALTALRANAMAARAALGLVAVALAAVVVAIVRYTKAQQTQAQVQRMMNDLRKDATQKCADLKTKIETLVAAAKNETLALKDRQTAINALNKLVPGYNAQLDATTGKYKANKQALDKYLDSLVKMYEVMGAKEKLRELGKEKSDAQTELDEANKALNDAKNSGGGYSYTTSWGMVGNTTEDLITKRQEDVNKAKSKMAVIVSKEKAILKSYGAKIQKQEIEEIETENNGNNGGGGGGVPTSSGSTTTTVDKSHEDKFKVEKEWKEKEEALNRIAYATGQIDYEEYSKKTLEITAEYNQKILSRKDLSVKERLEAETGYYEALKKLKDEKEKQSVEQEEAEYSRLVAIEKQRYIDGKIDKETYDNTVEILELQHLKKLVSIYDEGSKERLQAEKRYQDKLMADKERNQKEVEKKEKEHQDRLAKMKDEYFGDNPEERQKKYDEDKSLLDEVYDKEIKAAGDNAKEKLRIEEAYELAKKALKEKYHIEEEEDEKSWLEKSNEAITKWIKDPKKGQLVTRAIQEVSKAMDAIFSQLTANIQAETEIQVASIEKRYDQEISRAEGNRYKVKQLEKKKEADIAKIKNDANKKMFAMQVIQAIAQTATAAINAYSSAAAIKVIGPVLAPIAAAAAIAAGMLQVANIKKQQQAAAAQGYAEGGYTGKGKKDEVAGVVHKGEWVASQRLVNSPVTGPMIEALEYAQRNTAAGMLQVANIKKQQQAADAQGYAEGGYTGKGKKDEVAGIVHKGEWVASQRLVNSPVTSPIIEVLEYAQRNNTIGSLNAGTTSPIKTEAPTVIIQQAAPTAEDSGLKDVLVMLNAKLQQPFVTVNTVEGDYGIKQAQDEYDKLMRNKTPKSRRKNNQ